MADDYYIGPANSWGIHGLWPDDCDGDYSEECDSSRDYDDITSLIEEYGTTQLLSDMNTYWNSYDETNEEFWEHEWYTHGTCISTLDPSCYTDYETGVEAVDFFQITVDLFKSLVFLALSGGLCAHWLTNHVGYIWCKSKGTERPQRQECRGQLPRKDHLRCSAQKYHRTDLTQP